MKRKLIFTSLSLLIVISTTFLILFLVKQSKDIYIDHNVKYVSKVDDRDFLIYQNGKFNQTFLTGVNIGATLPGTFPGELAITKEDYLRWFKYIYEMNADVIRAYTTMMPAFYDALSEFNAGKSKPLYLMQGLWMNEDTSKLLGDAYANDEQLLKELIFDGKTLIDIMHGNIEIDYNPGLAYGSYTKDVSRYVIGWILGVEWQPDFVIGTNENNPNKLSFNGTYLNTTPLASPFEVFLAEMGDAIIDYEMTKYNMMRPLAFTNWLTTDLLSHPNEPDAKEDIVSVNTEHIKSTDQYLSGMFASYHVYPYYPEFMNYSNEYDTFIDDTGQVNTYKAYLRDLFQAHTMPVIVAEFGIPASRGKAHDSIYSGYNQGFISETEQGEMLSSLLKDIHDEGYMGGLVFSWQDEWFKRTWNTMDFDLPHRRPFWSNVQTNEQMFGLLSLEPGENQRISYADGDFSEWSELSPVYEDTEIKLYIQTDERYLYLYIDSTEFNFNDDYLYIPILTLPDQGNDYLIDSNITFSHPTDFLIQIHGEQDSRITVDAYYDSFYYLYSETLKALPINMSYHVKNSGIFNPMLLALSGKITLPEDGVTLPFKSYETGKLRYGNANPKNDDYDSLSDFYVNENGIEIQIPWALLNITDPSSKMQLGDYYEFSSFLSIPIEGIRIGAAHLSSNQDTRLIQMNSYTWSIWEFPVYHERLKQSYFILKTEFKKYN